MRPSGVTRNPGPNRRRWFSRISTAGGIGTLSLVVILVGVRFLAPAWWAVPGLVLGSVGQQIPRQISPGNQTLPSNQPVATTVPSTGGVPANPVARPFGNTPGPAVQPGSTPTPASLLASLTAGTALPQQRFTILLLGSDNDKKFAADAVLTQSMILVSIDPTTHQVAMVSIPRDFWVPIPTYGDQKIDVAYEVGGVALARRTVEELFGIHVDYYAWVGLDGLVKVIDSLGGVDVTVLHPVLDETYPDDLNGTDPYAFFRLYIPAGPQHLDGTTALEYVRSRHGDLQSDFGRSARQQQVLLAIKDRVTDPSAVSHIPDLAESLNTSVKTDLTLPQIIQLAAMARGVTTSQIHQKILAAPQYAALGWSPDHQEQIVIPDWPAIRPEIAQLLHLHPDGVSAALADQARQEQATIGVLNGTGEASLASEVKDYLRWQGLSVVSTGNARNFDYGHSQILARDASKPATAQLLAAVLHASVVNPPDPTLTTDVVVIVGRDHPTVPVFLSDTPIDLSTATPSPLAMESPTPRVFAVISTTPTPVTAGAGQVIVPSLIGMPEAAARRLIQDSGLMTTYVNYQTAKDVADHAYFLSIAPGAVLSQIPPPGTRVSRGTRVALAVRKS
jgi:LCP family protein required for cell wall assembly